MSSARRAALALLGTTITLSAGCHANRVGNALPIDDRARVYTTVLAEVQHESRADWVVLDSLLPTDDIDDDVAEKVVQELPISRRALDAFLAEQRTSVDRFQSVSLPSAHWRAASVQQLDSLRATVRAGIIAGTTPREPNNDAFWSLFQRRFPAAAGYVMLSPASITEDGTTALVHVRTACGSICGQTELRRLRRDASGAWHTTSRLTVSEN